jgi:hypothetical protein
MYANQSSQSLGLEVPTRVAALHECARQNSNEFKKNLKVSLEDSEVLTKPFYVYKK